MQANDQMRTEMIPDCYACGSGGEMIYHGLRDRLFGVGGEWDLKKCTNPQCGLVWLDPMPVEADLGQAYAEYFTHGKSRVGTKEVGGSLARRFFKYLKHGHLATRYGYGKGVGGLQRIMGYSLYLSPSLIRSLRKGVRYVENVSQGKLLDVGCGDGAYLQYMQGLGWDVSGVDFDPDAVSAAQARGVAVKLGDLAEQKYPDNMFDVITLNHVIEHVPRPSELLRECGRVVKPGGRIIVVTPNAGSWGHRIFGSHWLHLDPPRHLMIFTRASLGAVAKSAGLQLVTFTTSEGAARTMLSSRSIKRTGHADLRARHSLISRIWAEAMEAVEGLLKIVNRDAGQELVLVVAKEK